MHRHKLVTMGFIREFKIKRQKKLAFYEWKQRLLKDIAIVRKKLKMDKTFKNLRSVLIPSKLDRLL